MNNQTILRKGDKLKSECIACDKEEVWQIEGITNEEYSDGIFKTYNLVAVKHCMGVPLKTSLKDVPEVMNMYSKYGKL